MKNISLYLEKMEGQLDPITRGSKREDELIETVKDWMLNEKPTTIKALKEELGFSTIQQIHSIITRSEKRGGALKRAKINGRTLVVVAQEETEEDES